MLTRILEGSGTEWLLIRVDVELDVWDAGVVKGRDTWKLETRLVDYIHLGFG
ncbi:hypothetical protein HanIR_Chr12g0600281 [Helianthus annuus]|nr:hypothetical protein HanIR_Chr12g0600281 [Helianthus annuus]